MTKQDLIQRAKDLDIYMNPSFQHDFFNFIRLDTVIHETKRFIYFNWHDNRQLRFFKESKRVTIAKSDRP